MPKREVSRTKSFDRVLRRLARRYPDLPIAVEGTLEGFAESGSPGNGVGLGGGGAAERAGPAPVTGDVSIPPRSGGGASFGLVVTEGGWRTNGWRDNESNGP